MRRLDVGRAIEAAAPAMAGVIVLAAALGGTYSDRAIIVACALAAVMAVIQICAASVTARRVGTAGLGWRLLACTGGLQLIAIGMRVYMTSTGADAETAEAVLHLEAVMVGLAALVVLGPADTIRRCLTTVDGLLVGSAVALVLWITALDEGGGLVGLPMWTRAAMIASLVLTVAMAMAALLALSGHRSDDPHRAPFTALAFAAVPLATSDAIGLVEAGGAYAPRVGGVAAAFLGIAVAALAAEPPADAPAEHRPTRLGSGGALLVPAAVVVTALGSVIVSATEDGVAWSTALAAAVLSVGLVVRHVLIAAEEQTKLAALEQRVEDRTGALEQRERYFRALVQNSSDAVIVFSADGYILDVSESVQQVIGWRPEDVRGLHLREIIHPDERDALRAAGLAILEDPAYTHVVECRVIGQDGRVRDTESTVGNLLDDPTIAAVVCNSRDVTDRKELERELATAAFSDPLTGLANRSTLLRELDDAMASAKERGGVVGLVFVDLDGFKQVNDTLGHQAGDELLCEIARRIGLAVRPGDLVARLGGDEFAILLREMDDPSDLSVVTSRLVRQVNRDFTFQGRRMPATASVGAAVSGAYASEPGDLLRNADLAMYDGKSKGKARVSYFRPELAVALEERFELESELRRALDHHELVLYYQPLVDLESDSIRSLEALVRWRHPHKGLLSPSAFIPIAEESDLIADLGKWALHESCRTLARLSVTPRGQQLSVAVNISGRHLASAELVNEVAAAMIATSVEPSRLTLEVTETLLFEETPEVISCLARLRRLGVKVAIDDFGTGYSSLSKLSRLPVDQLKLDGSFVWEMAESSAARAVVATVLGLGRSLDLMVVAEGIETAAQLADLREMGFQVGQGYHLMKPIPLDELEAVLAVEEHIGRIL